MLQWHIWSVLMEWVNLENGATAGVPAGGRCEFRASAFFFFNFYAHYLKNDYSKVYFSHSYWMP